MTTTELAAKLNVSLDTVYRMCKSGKWPAAKLGRIYRFTEENYQAIIAPPAAPQKPRTQRKNIERLLRSA
ncbi:helix-turn-helix domain-containing protein [Arthrobacter sp. GMC3]|uniref:helix-turn-helix domain-containing protein n=1 Tax=Arthrobacter sp. GMC3 TaxID=2058894 RepID=UPI0015E45B9B|nr:helix-turn-helix domain-containing protein [Arthrobacter sp. GMC3]